MLPAPVSTVAPSLATGRPLRWGVVATGSIALRVVEDLALLEDAVLQAVSSRSEASARSFAEKFGFATAYSDARGTPGYERLLADPAVDVVYVATPHAQHHAVALAALHAGKHVLCEKPIAMDAAQARELADLARDKGLFLMEAVWTRFLPSFCRAMKVLRSGEIGEPRWLQADLGFVPAYDPASRIWDPAAGGGALLDLAVYPLTWALGVFGEPDSLIASGSLTPQGVDLQNSLALNYRTGTYAQLITSIGAECPSVVTVGGSEGWLRSSASLFNPAEIIIQPRNGTLRTERFKVLGHGFSYELREVTRCLQAGLTESPFMTPEESVGTMELLDEARRQMGLRYPSDPQLPISTGPLADIPEPRTALQA
ncbi:Gfo/Idh/MocA family oxidoreductase [Paenarthrobacter aurescens]|uniref:Oxidoreductase n=1 Tax=Paenarthrobacter aurescens TaxID=43663 RepID=A0A4Y3NDR2_PAEAU|nr:Gfo/Idh/MocA family oxidoreductase [Paenarthrobacter aurescens]MDO6141782.1 Gfo/Idh/MocA family oxidoreductase [Paenarthrobacter aurescens]MDO6149545.1 Gfo/Idh/MocA family oxidoreductase [Paenarthrobacter aurescens]MDO6156831.1 Gfo/Idh/MocA family oxidoreductase [Paenarthrobacter aurescens]MDO6160817.1 Gfo/Idh/MocA family oxidoreductase [Paenarthrobacter aurescens]GEB18565.1 oxidoreductase [Paenarthrobacter aurescens]